MYIQEQIQACIAHCNMCSMECEKMLFTHCVEEGGAHLDPKHARLMADCIDICHIATLALLRESEMYHEICMTCADICDACADSCEKIDSKEMQHCAEICRQCAQTCRAMGDNMQVPPSDSSSEGAVMA